MSKVLVTGGCGYIGSHTIVDLIQSGFEVICLDNLVNSDENVLNGIFKITGKQIVNHKVDLLDSVKLAKVFDENNNIKGIIHFAALKSVNDSVHQPLKYYDNNITGLLNLLEIAKQHKINHFIFSSSCSVYGDSDQLPVTEDTPLKEAQCPYAYTKQAGERIIQDITRVTNNFSSILLRYFNPAGAHSTSLIGESPRNIANNLVPVITETAIGKRQSMTIFGSDYETRDGTCIRDYIHVMDIAHAHTLALKYLLDQPVKQNESLVFNLGTGEGITVKEAIDAFEQVNGTKLNYTYSPRREGDVVAVYANNQKAREILNWIPSRNIHEIMRSAWEWEKVRSTIH
jgi:UDP-glucose 4-epimerase